VDKDNMVYIHSRVLLSHKEVEMISLAGKWVELEIVMLKDISQT
jgi:hypothetical protein